MLDIEVTGLREFASGAARAGTTLPEKTKNRLSELAKRVASMARGRVVSRSGRAAGSVAAHGTDVVAGSGVAYYGWLDFGGTLRPTGGRHNRIERAYTGPMGRYLFPALEANREAIEKAGQESVKDALRESGI